MIISGKSPIYRWKFPIEPPFFSRISQLSLHVDRYADIFPGDRTREPVGGQGGGVVRAAPKIRIYWWYDIDNMLWMVI